MFTLRYKLKGVAFYANKLPYKRTIHSNLQECGVISPLNLDYNFDLNLQFSSPSAIGHTSGRECWSRSMYRLVARFDPQFSLLFPVRLYFARSLVVVPILVLSAPKRWFGSGFVMQSTIFILVSIFRTSSFFWLWALGCDETVPQCVSSLHGGLDFKWGVLHSGSCNRWSVLDGRVAFSPRSRLTIDATTLLPSLRLMVLCTRPLW